MQAETLRSRTGSFWLIVIGHGTFDLDGSAKFNLSAISDISDVELTNWTKPIKRPMAVIDCSASSSPFLQKLSAPNRVIITATRSGTEINLLAAGRVSGGGD